jgi:hypothetical protein
MPQAFDNCQSSGGKIRTKKIDSTHYLHICIPKGGGKAVSGEVKAYKKILKGKNGRD